MFLKNHMDRNLVFANLKPADKLSLLEALAEKTAARLPSIDRSELLRSLKEREDQVSTGIGHGVAIPHTTVEGLTDTVCLVAQLPGGIDFEALDASPVHLVFLLISPPERTGKHIRLLARIARLVSDETFVYQIATAADAAALFARVVHEDQRHV